jgi:hypothetical protein
MIFGFLELVNQLLSKFSEQDYSVLNTLRLS